MRRTVLATIAGVLVATNLVAAPKGGGAPAPSEPVSRAEPNHLIAFVGRVLDFRVVRRKGLSAERAAKFEVLQVLYGSYSGRTISFASYAHEGGHDLGAHEYWIVYVSKNKTGRLVQETYLGQPVYPTADGRWAGCGDPYAKMPPDFPHIVQPEPVIFSPPVKFKTQGLSRRELDQLLGLASTPPPNKFKTRSLSPEELDRLYPKQFFRRDEDSVTCIMGNYPRELFRVMSETYLQNRRVTSDASK
jgi:hypothetical protein